ncbi:hypothetical protein [Rufibacter hautae]|uniref:Uncharacterized protein n=1 Tax=Rufibacter hautae TaxID=2595005 RepID=A0A5B6TJK7_9BACT|nr:hypothetical protein [Rufibacter hautae]KAA3439569.1 hypothetical protein FOA19_02470 [Rufibacter hautae]
MRTKEYNALFRELAEQHVDLLHSEKNMRFVRMTLSSDPMQRVLDLTEFNNSIKHKIKDGFFMVLQNYEAGFSDNGGDRTSKVFYGAFLILRNVDPNNVDAQEQAYDETERIGEEIMAAAIERINNYGGVPLTRISPSNVSSDQVAKVALQYFGTRFDFSFTMASKALKYNKEKFNG